MTPADLEALGVRVKPLVWNAAREARHMDRAYCITLADWSSDTWNVYYRKPFDDTHTLGLNVSRSAAIAAANAHHAAQVAGMLEGEKG